MRVTRVSSTKEFQQLATSWNVLAGGVPFREWEWLSTWWRHYGSDRELYVLSVRDEHDRLIGLLPLCLERNATHGRVLRLLGSGEICTDYVTVLTTPEHESAVVEALAYWLVEAASQQAHDNDLWDLLELDGILESDVLLGNLVGILDEAGSGVHRRPGQSCWKLSLPQAWDDLPPQLSKPHRRHMRRLQRDSMETGRAVFRIARSPEEVSRILEIFIDLHQQRRQSLGEPGCFASDRFAAFIRDVTHTLQAIGKLELAWIELDRRPVAVDYSLITTDTTYVYQGGLDPAVQEQSPGHLLTMAFIQHSIQQGRSAFDLLRGDERYKSDWRAKPQPTVRWRVSANRLAPRLRHGVWLAGLTVKNWVNSGLNMTGMK